MASSNATARTNYVAVTDLGGLKEALQDWPITVAVDNSGRVALVDNHPDSEGWPTVALDLDGIQVELDIAEHIMPFVKEGEVLVLLEAGNQKKHTVFGWAGAWIRRGEDVDKVELDLQDIYQMAADEFGVERGAITHASE